MWKKKCMPLIIAASISTILIIVLLALGIPLVVFTNACLVIGLLGALAAAIIASENITMQCRLLNLHPGEDRCCVKRLHWLHRLTIWTAICLLIYLLLLCNLIVLGVLELGLLPFWFLCFLFIALVVSLL